MDPVALTMIILLAFMVAILAYRRRSVSPFVVMAGGLFFAAFGVLLVDWGESDGFAALILERPHRFTITGYGIFLGGSCMDSRHYLLLVDSEERRRQTRTPTDF